MKGNRTKEQTGKQSRAGEAEWEEGERKSEEKRGGQMKREEREGERRGGNKEVFILVGGTVNVSKRHFPVSAIDVCHRGDL